MTAPLEFPVSLTECGNGFPSAGQYVLFDGETCVVTEVMTRVHTSIRPGEGNLVYATIAFALGSLPEHFYHYPVGVRSLEEESSDDLDDLDDLDDDRGAP
jgi:hypothetical protein